MLANGTSIPYIIDNDDCVNTMMHAVTGQNVCQCLPYRVSYLSYILTNKNVNSLLMLFVNFYKHHEFDLNEIAAEDLGLLTIN